MSGIRKLLERFFAAQRGMSATADSANEEALSVRAIQENIPYYLTEDAKDGLVRALRDFPENLNYYTRYHEGELLQGDGWTKFQVFDFKTGQRALVRGLVLSNTCDVAAENPRDLPYRIVFAPIIRLPDYISALKNEGIEEAKIDAKITAIRRQSITNIFYLPQGGALDCDYIARLDDIHSVPSASFFNEAAKISLFTLSNVGFYLFLFKLSVHFCRFHEKVERDSACA